MKKQITHETVKRAAEKAAKIISRITARLDAGQGNELVKKVVIGAYRASEALTLLAIAATPICSGGKVASMGQLSENCTETLRGER